MAETAMDSCKLLVLYPLVAITIQFCGKVSGSVAQSGSTADPPLNGPFPPSVWNGTCPHSNTSYVYSAPQGTIVWDETLCPEICDPCDFVLRVPDGYELAVEFHEVNMWFEPGLEDGVTIYDEENLRAGDKLVVQCVEGTAFCFNLVNVLRTVQGSLPVAPLWFKANMLHLLLYTTHHIHKVDGLIPKSRFNISYSSVVKLKYNYTVLEWSYYWHDCTSITIIPDFLKCDKIFQCYGYDERGFILIPVRIFDEEKCDYQSEGCGVAMVPFRDECFSLNNLVMEYQFETPSACPMFSESAAPAAFLDPDVRNFILNKASLAGKHRIITGMERMQTDDRHLNHLYGYQWWWKSYRTVMYDPSLDQYWNFAHKCAVFFISVSGHMSMRSMPCGELTTPRYLSVCHKYNPKRKDKFRSKKLTLSLVTTIPDKFATKVCKLHGGFHFHPFHPCGIFSTSLTRLSSVGLSLFHCDNGLKVHYTLTCDGYDDCGDKSDEKGCNSVSEWIHDSPFNASFFSCKDSLEMIDIGKRCDGKPTCMDGSDEDNCIQCNHSGEVPLLSQPDLPTCCYSPRVGSSFYDSEYPGEAGRVYFKNTYGPQNRRAVLQQLRLWRVELDGYGGSYLEEGKENESCPETHIHCPNAYCIPSYMLNNGFYDCPFLDTDDEYVAKRFSCPGFYRCYRSHICVHNHYLCDGVFHCPLKDDERYCDVRRTCPNNCTCEGLAMTCKEMIDPSKHFHVRYLDVSGTYQPLLHNVHFMGFLQFLNLSGCSLNNLTLTHMDHLKVLDVSYNQLHTLSSLSLLEMVALRQLDLSNNPQLLTAQGLLKEFLYNHGPMRDFRMLVLQNTGLTSVEPNVFQNVPTLEYLDLRNNDIVGMNRDSFKGLGDLKLLQADDIKFCCIYKEMFPTSNTDCHAPEDELSSCSDLLRSQFFRVGLWLLSLLAVLGNGVVLVYRLFFETQGTATGFRVLVANLCISDFTMGVYLLIIGSADLHYSGKYLWRHRDWTHSAPCRVAGFLGLLSSEVSAFIICLITLDRLLVLRFPLRHRLHLTRKSTVIACCIAWGFGLALAAFPLLPFTEDWEFYSQTGICLPLPITRHQFPGQCYAFTVFVCLNFILFLLIGAGQLSISQAIHNTPTAGRTQRRQQDMAIARRLFLIVFTDFCCWFPVGVMGLLAARGTPIPGVVNVWTAIFVLPLNSALNPFLYTLSTLLERRRKQKEQRRTQTLISSVQSDSNKWPADKLEEFFRSMLTTRRLTTQFWTAERVMQIFRNVDLQTWPAEEVIQLFRTVNTESWSVEQITQLLRTVKLNTADEAQHLFSAGNLDSLSSGASNTSPPDPSVLRDGQLNQ